MLSFSKRKGNALGAITLNEMKEKPKALNWGIIGLGGIAHAFVQDLLLLDSANLLAVASRTQAKANAFAQQYGAKRAYGSYEEIMNDKEVDILYIATPHDSHKSLAIDAMQSGKHVLCEKPMSVSRSQVEQMIHAARANNVFLMEAFWSRFNPSISEVLQRVKRGELGEVNYVNADFSFYREDPDDSRMLNMDLAGGSLLDMGVYPVFLSYMVLGIPLEIQAVGQLHSTGADLQTAAIFKYNNAVAQIMSGFKSQSDMRARICGTKASIFIEPIWHETQSYSFLENQSGEITNFKRPTNGKGFTYEIEECTACINAGKQESEKWTWQNSLDLMKITDEIRRQIGIKYPFE